MSVFSTPTKNASGGELTDRKYLFTAASGPIRGQTHFKYILAHHGNYIKLKKRCSHCKNIKKLNKTMMNVRNLKLSVIRLICGTSKFLKL